MFNKYSKDISKQETVSPYQKELPLRPHSPFSTDLMNSFSVRDEAESNTDEEPETIISGEIDIKGTMSFHKLLRIDGTFEGELISSGKLIIGPTGFVKANLNLDSAFIAGKVVGDITVKTRLVLRGKAEIRGNITAPLISIDEGVSIIGQLNVASVNPIAANDAFATEQDDVL